MPHPRPAFSGTEGFSFWKFNIFRLRQRATNHPVLAPCRFALRSFLPPTRSATVRRPPILAAPCSGAVGCLPKLHSRLFPFRRCAIARVFSHRAGWNRYPRRARSTPGSRFALCLSWNRARLPLRGLRSFVAAAAPRNKCSVAHEARAKGEPACAAEGWFYEPPAAPHCRGG